MTGPNIIDLIAQTGGMTALAIFAIWMLNRVWADRVAAAERYAESLRRLHGETRSVIERNTEVIARLLERFDDR